jgi:hypothetical protein
MSDRNSTGNSLKYFTIGALCVAFIGTGIYFLGGYAEQDQADFSISVDEKGIDVDTNE